MLGAEQGQGLGLCWQGSGKKQVGLTRRQPDSTLPLGVPAWSHPPPGTARWRWEIITLMWAQLLLREHL